MSSILSYICRVDGDVGLGLNVRVKSALWESVSSTASDFAAISAISAEGNGISNVLQWEMCIINTIFVQFTSNTAFQIKGQVKVIVRMEEQENEELNCVHYLDYLARCLCKE